MESAAPARPAGRPWWRVALVATAVIAVLAASAAIAYRVLAPAEIVTEATAEYPAAAPEARPGVIGTLAAAPLVVDGRLRVYATKRQIRADAPVDARTQRSPFWSYRRWPEQLVGVVAVGTTVVGRWSDGKLVAIDGRTGLVAWRTDGPAPGAAGYDGRRTGARTVYAPDGLATAGDVITAWNDAGVLAVAARDGTVLWRRSLGGASCRAGGFTTAGGLLAVRAGCPGQARSLDFYRVRSGDPAGTWRHPSAAEVAPLGCRIGRSECAGMWTAPADPSAGSEPADPSAGSEPAAGEGAPPGQGWLLRGTGPVAAPGLSSPDAWLVAASGPGVPGGAEGTGVPGTARQPVALAVSPSGDGALVARRADTGEQVWRWLPGGSEPSGRARVVATQPGRVHLLTAGYRLVTVDAGTGVELSSFVFTYGKERTGWAAGHAYAAHGFVLLERLTPGVDRAAADDEYYFIRQPVLLAGT